MTLTVLFDLDDTLINNDINVFLPVYLKKLGRHLAPLPPDQVIHHLLAATSCMTQQTRPISTLEETFDKAFYPSLHITKDSVKDKIDSYYADVFPSLREFIKPNPQAPILIEQCLKLGYKVVIATNPLFPLTANLQRMDWGGLSIQNFPVNLVTSFETFHFSKPHSMFVAEVLAQLGWPEGPAVMVGNSLADDLLPAALLGLPGYLVSDQTIDLPNELPPVSSQGNLDGVLVWLAKIADQDSQEGNTSYLASLATLASTPAALDTLRRKINSDQWMQRPGPEDWNLIEILSHLRDVDSEVNFVRINRILKEEIPFLPGIDTDRWAKERDYARQTQDIVFQQFRDNRLTILDILTNLTSEECSRPAKHAIFGPTSLEELTAFSATHDRTHIRQIFDAVGLA